MQYSSTLVLAAIAVTSVFSHGFIDLPEGASGATMPGLSVVHSTRRDCTSSPCGSEADASIIGNAAIADPKDIRLAIKHDQAEKEGAAVIPSSKKTDENNEASTGSFGGFFGVSRSQAEEKNRAKKINLSKRHFARALASQNAEDDAAAAVAELEKPGSVTKDDQAEI